MQPKASDALIVALDHDHAAPALALVDALGDAVSFYKVGHPVVLGSETPCIRALLDRQKKVFLDYKFLDVEETVMRSVAAACKLGLTFITLHAYPKIMRAAARARGDNSLKLLAVTVLTALDQSDLDEMGITMPLEELVIKRAKQAKAAGFDGIVASGREAAMVRAEVGPDFIIVTPGIRPAGTSVDDHKRPTTPASAIANGANYLVVGRPIAEAKDPVAAANRIIGEIAGAR
jgi:orotidine-5'-phosphate decarboxylase